MTTHRLRALFTCALLASASACVFDASSGPDGGSPPDAAAPMAPVIEQGDALDLEVRAGSSADDAFNAVTLSAVDDDLAPLGWRLAQAPAHGEASLDDDETLPGAPVTVRYAPTAGFVGADAFEVQVTDGDGLSDLVTVAVTVAPTLAIVLDGLPVGEVGTAYAATIAAAHAREAPLTWELADGVLPPGLTLGSDGVTATLTGTPSAAGSSPVRLRVREPSGVVAEREFIVHVNAAGAVPPVVADVLLPPGQVDQPYARSVGVDGGTPPYQIFAEAGAPAPGLRVLPHPGLARAVIAGRPTAAVASAPASWCR
ncbi:MAG: Ig-like domain-containing protein [Kofleriaceae bacterium]